jgi:WD40 repeat protein
MTFSPDSKTLVIAGQDGRITEWRMPAFEYNAVNSFHRREVTGLSYRTRQNSPFLLSSDRDGQLLICQSGIAVQNCGIMARVGSSVQTLMAGPGLDDVVVVGANDLYWFNLNHDYMLRKAREHAGQ